MTALPEAWTISIIKDGDCQACFYYNERVNTRRAWKETEKIIDFFQKDENLNEPPELVAFKYIAENEGLMEHENWKELFHKYPCIYPLRGNFAGGVLYTGRSRIASAIETYGITINFDNDNIETDMFSLFFDFKAILEDTGLKMPLFKVYNVPVKNLIDCNFLDFDKYQNYWYNSAICISADGGFYALLH